VTDKSTVQRLEGVIPALAVPMHEGGAVDMELVARQAGYLGQADIRGVFVGGTTGEGAYLSGKEKLAILESVKGLLPRRVALCAACIQPSTDQVIEEMHLLSRARPDFYVAVTPYYLAVSQEAILDHFRRIAAQAPAPLILYNIPQNTHNPMRLETILELAAETNVAGIKDSSGDFITFTRGVLSAAPGPFVWIMGEDLLEAPARLLGAGGVVTGLGNVWIDPYVELDRASRERDVPGMLAGQRKINSLFRVVEAAEGKGIPAIKAAMELLGRGRRHMRLGALTATQEEIEKIRQVLVSLGLL
jgi:4-hydroxy-tetrahydrodipicolinate synthase